MINKGRGFYEMNIEISIWIYIASIQCKVKLNCSKYDYKIWFNSLKLYDIIMFGVNRYNFLQFLLKFGFRFNYWNIIKIYTYLFKCSLAVFNQTKKIVNS